MGGKEKVLIIRTVGTAPIVHDALDSERFIGKTGIGVARWPLFYHDYNVKRPLNACVNTYNAIAMYSTTI